VDTKAVRQWASENGYNVSSRGRIPAEVVQAYEAANKPADKPAKKTAKR
jgi:hypothetical protein